VSLKPQKRKSINERLQEGSVRKTGLLEIMQGMKNNHWEKVEKNLTFSTTGKRGKMYADDQMEGKGEEVINTRLVNGQDEFVRT